MRHDVWQGFLPEKVPPFTQEILRQVINAGIVEMVCLLSLLFPDVPSVGLREKRDETLPRQCPGQIDRIDVRANAHDRVLSVGIQKQIIGSSHILHGPEGRRHKEQTNTRPGVNPLQRDDISDHVQQGGLIIGKVRSPYQDLDSIIGRDLHDLLIVCADVDMIENAALQRLLDGVSNERSSPE